MCDKNKVCCENCIYDDEIHYDGNDEEMNMDDDKCMECTNYDYFEPKENK